MMKNIKTIFSFFLAVLLILPFSVCVFADETTPTYATGLIWDDDETIAAHMLTTAGTPGILPSAVDNTANFPPPGHQGTQGSCTAWAVGYALASSQEGLKRGWSMNTNTHWFSPAFIYNQLCTGQHSGIHISDAMTLIVQQGVCPLSYFPYNATDWTTQPTAIQSAAASLYKPSSWSTTSGIDMIKYFLSIGNGVVIGTLVNSDFNEISSENPIYDTFSEEDDTGAHAICLIGYDDSMGNGAFKFINSWGPNWGLDGYGWISYDLVADTNVNLHKDAAGYVFFHSQSDSYLLGDIDGDNQITSGDARLALRFSVSLETPTAEQYVRADVDGDASVSAGDAREILRYSVGLSSNFSIYD